MAINNPFAITYGALVLGGESDTYQLHDPYVIDKSFEELRLVFTVVVVAGSYENLKELSDVLEDGLRVRDQNLTISIDGRTRTFTNGVTMLNSKASISKSGNPQTDKGYSRAYTIVIEAGLPADDRNGLQEIEFSVNYESSRQRIVNVRGIYTAANGQSASANYLAQADGEISTFLSALSGSPTFEVVSENYGPDRNDQICTFERQMLEVIYSQSQSTLNSTKVVDPQIMMTDTSQHPGDSMESVRRMRRVIGTFDCSVDLEQAPDPYAVYESDVKPYITKIFRDNYQPKVFGLEGARVSFELSGSKLSVEFQFLYQRDDGEDVVEISESSAIQESRSLDRTPVHNGDELAAYVDAGFGELIRVVTRTAIVVGEEQPHQRLFDRYQQGILEDFKTLRSGVGVQNDGWTMMKNTSQVTPRWVGGPEVDDQIRLTMITETVTESFSRRPQGTTTVAQMDPSFQGPNLPPRKDFRTGA